MKLKPFDKSLPILSALIMPLKLSVTYLPLFPAIVLTIKKYVLDKQGHWNIALKNIFSSFQLFIAAMFISVLMGVDPSKGIFVSLKMIFYSFIIVVFYDYVKKYSVNCVALALLLGCSIAGVDSVLESAFPQYYKTLFLGKVTESGQLALTTIFAVGYKFYLDNELRNTNVVAHSSILANKNAYLIGILVLLTAVIAAFAKFFPHSIIWAIIFSLILIVLLVWLSIIIKRLYKTEALILLSRFFVTAIALPLTIATLILNLKRGPWLGVAIAGLLYLFLTKRKLILPTIISGIIALLLFFPVRERLEVSGEHFFISGGRSTIWQIGKDFIVRYPFGVGHKNSRTLRSYSEGIPQEHRHFHNNYIQIAAENGWLSLAAFLLWLFCILKIAFRKVEDKRVSLLNYSIGCAIVAWQLAGIFEYNFGDSEVLFVVFLLLGILAGHQESVDDVTMEFQL